MNFILQILVMIIGWFLDYDPKKQIDPNINDDVSLEHLLNKYRMP
jgi:hypothetical protein